VVALNKERYLYLHYYYLGHRRPSPTLRAAWSFGPETGYLSAFLQRQDKVRPVENPYGTMGRRLP